MAHFAELNENNEVLRVIVVANQEILDAEGNEQESIGVNFCQTLFGGTWVQTSYNGSMRKNFAGVGFTYDNTRDAFIPLQPFPSWTLDESTCRWVAPTAHPEDGLDYIWDEATTSWVAV